MSVIICGAGEFIGQIKSKLYELESCIVLSLYLKYYPKYQLQNVIE